MAYAEMGRSTYLKNTQIRGACYDGVDARRSLWWRTIFSNVSFRGAGLQYVDMRGCELYDVDFTGCDLTGAKLSETRLRRCTFDDAILTGTVLEPGVTLRGHSDFVLRLSGLERRVVYAITNE